MISPPYLKISEISIFSDEVKKFSQKAKASSIGLYPMAGFDVGNCNCEIQQNPDSEKKLETQFSLKLFHFSQGRLEINPWNSGGMVVIITTS